MLDYKAGFTYVTSKDARLFTVYLLPNEKDRFPVVVVRTPYVDELEEKAEDEVAIFYLNAYKEWPQNGYAVVIQHCRGRGKSEGDCIPYINEREDGLKLQDWIRKQPFYNGELFLLGASYLSSVHFVTAPFASDVKGAIFGVQDTQRYNICYRNGFLKKGLHGVWYVSMYKAKSHMKKNYTIGAFNMLPLKDFSKTVFGEPAEDFDQMLKAPNPDDDFWNTPIGGSDAKDATVDADFPMLFTTGFYDIYTGGIFDMWKNMSDESRSRSALVVSPYGHGDDCDEKRSILFPKGKRVEQYGENYEIKWCDHIRGILKESPFEKGKITYYNLFENQWRTDDFYDASDIMEISLGKNEISYVYNPYDPPEFQGGLSCNSGGTVFQDKPGLRHDIISVYTDPFEKEVWVKGKMSAELQVKSDCEDTCFYMRISIEKEGGDYGLRDDITSLCYQLGDYIPGTMAKIGFQFDEHSFLIKKGERIRIDISSADNAHFVRHTNNKGLYSGQTTAKIAHNTVILQNSYLQLPLK